jgi:hypothetical protein
MGQNASPVSVCLYSYLPLGVGLIQALGPAQHLTALVIPIAGFDRKDGRVAEQGGRIVQRVTDKR